MLQPTREDRFRLRPSSVNAAYGSWPKIVDLAEDEPSLGLLEKRGGALIDTDSASLVERMSLYFDGTRSLEALPASLQGLKTNWARFKAADTRDNVLSKRGFDESNVKRIVMKPMDVQWAYVETLRPLWNEPRPRLVDQLHHVSRFLLARRRAPRADDGAPFLVSRSLGEEHALHKDAYLIPMYVGATRTGPEDQIGLLDDVETEVRANVSPAVAAHLDRMGVLPEDTWMHVLAVGYAPAYF